MGEIGPHEKEVEFLPLGEPAPDTQPIQTPVPEKTPEKVPA